MLRVSKTQFEQLQLLYGNINAKSTKHGVYIVASGEELTAYKRFLCGYISKRQKNALHWALKKRHRTQNAPTD